MTHLLAMPTFRPGDPQPVGAGYLEWHEWADVQRKAGIKQTECPKCCKWFCPQDLSDKTHVYTLTNRYGEEIRASAKLCKGCAA